MGNKILVGSNFNFKNRIINGDFAIWQRGTSASYSSDSVNLTVESGYKTADRIFCANILSGGQFTVSKSIMNGFNSFKIIVDTPPDNLSWDGTNIRWWLPFRYRFEGQNLYDLVIQKKSITISFLFRSNVSGIYTISLLNSTSNIFNDGSIDAYITSFEHPGGNQVIRVEKSISLNHNWATYPKNDNELGFMLQIGAIGDALKATITDQWTNELALCGETVRIHPNYTNWAAQADNYIEIAQLQLEKGSYATEFEVVPYDVELQRCMRYYEVGMQDVIYSDGWDSTNAYSEIKFRVIKRSVPTITVENFKYWSNGTDTSFTPTIADVSIKRFQYRGLNLTNWNGFDGVGIWRADAEL